MPRCPSCGEIIQTLRYSASQSGSAWGTAYLRHDNLDYEEGDSDIDNSEILNFACPECDHEISIREERAIEFLRGDDEGEEDLEEEEKFGIFLCEKHNIKFTAGCEKCLNEETKKEETPSEH